MRNIYYIDPGCFVKGLFKQLLVIFFIVDTEIRINSLSERDKIVEHQVVSDEFTEILGQLKSRHGDQAIKRRFTLTIF